MAYTETKVTGYGTRVGNSLGGIVVGFILFIAGTCLLWWNEGNAVDNAKALEEMQGAFQHVESVAKVDPNLNGELIHATAMADTKDSLSDSQFGVGAVAIRLDRDVEYYQWVQEEHTTKEDKMGGKEVETTTYTYKQEWTSEPQNSSEFKDPAYKGKNSIIYAGIEDETWNAKKVMFGAYDITGISGSISGGQEMDGLDIPEDILKKFDKDITSRKGDTGHQAVQESVKAVEEVAEGDTAAAEIVKNDDFRFKYIHVNDGIIYLGADPGNPQIGDMRIKFTAVYPHKISVVAKVLDNTLVKHVAKNGKSRLLIQNGTKSPEEMFQTAAEGDSMWCWILRIVGILVVIGGLKSMFSILYTVLKVVPFLASIGEFAVGLVTGIIGFVWSILIIAIAWLFYRPLIGIALIAAVVGILLAFRNRGAIKAKLNEKMAASEQAPKA